MKNQPSRTRSKTIEEFSRALSHDGVSVRSRCYKVSDEDGSRFEILLDAAGQRALVDVSPAHAKQMEKLLREAVHGFATSVSMRLGKDKRL